MRTSLTTPDSWLSLYQLLWPDNRETLRQASCKTMNHNGRMHVQEQFHRDNMPLLGAR
ncbi:uncharacterized protein CLUP02_13934 [Colletotrichum lupini]|uniref:Uncharacterized protein n=1 Tax=Colletotrichum lupini TaxID=145971 RepID=A0A9Q8T3M0_9PEZI|nr:uncharacterized protein CLUP02_13934 [Colletotrichum lupini]UQC88410.1 hypothetical protein CLUP02_13934 [Colletotrichum lupini]